MNSENVSLLGSQSSHPSYDEVMGNNPSSSFENKGKMQQKDVVETVATNNVASGAVTTTSQPITPITQRPIDNQANKLGQQLLSIAKEKDDKNIEALYDMLKKGDVDINYADEHGNTALHYAAMTNNVHAFFALGSRGAKETVNQQGKIPTDFVSGELEIALILNAMVVLSQDKK